MATSSFSKNFIVEEKKADEFVEELTKEVSPTLDKDFLSRLTHIDENTEVKNSLNQALKHKNNEVSCENCKHCHLEAYYSCKWYCKKRSLFKTKNIDVNECFERK